MRRVLYWIQINRRKTRFNKNKINKHGEKREYAVSYRAINVIENYSKTVMNFSSWFAHVWTCAYVVGWLFFVFVVSAKHMYLPPVIIHANTCRTQVNAPSIPTSILHYQHYIFLAMPSLARHPSACHPIPVSTPLHMCAPSNISNSSANKNIVCSTHIWYVFNVFRIQSVINIHYNISSTIKPPFIHSFSVYVYSLETKQPM